MRALAAAAAIMVTACAPGAEMELGATAADEVATWAGTSDGLPSQAPQRFGFGSEASTARVAAWDIDVRPDGAGLPAGSGTAVEGKQVYDLYCLSCHGPTGSEGPDDRLVGRGPWEDYPSVRSVGSYWPYATTLYDYIRKAMPQLTPGVLTADQTYGVIAYILYLNEIVAEDAVLNAETLPQVEMPARDRFVVDDREGGVGPIR